MKKYFKICPNGMTKVSNNDGNSYSLHHSQKNDREYYINLGYTEV